jgi:hypothetical protein
MTAAQAWLLEKLGRLPSGTDFTISGIGSIEEFEVRDEFVQKFGFAILTDNIVEVLKKYSPILEVGAGSGYWASELQKAGVDIVATDALDYAKYTPVWSAHNYTVVVPLKGVEAVQKYPDRALLLVWPSYAANWATDSLKAFKGSTVLYVGEGDGGCTANDEFHQILRTEFEEIEDISMSQFWGIHDRLTIYKRK